MTLFRHIFQAAATLLVLVTPLKAEIAIQEVTSPGGITAWLVEEHGIPFAALNIRFLGGTSLDLPGKRGAVNLMTGLLEEGAGEMNAQGFAAARDALAAEFSFRSDVDGVSVSSRFLTENRDAAMALLKQALIAPRFDPDAVERVRGQVLAGLRGDEKDPDAIASALMDARVFGSHPYGSNGDGTIASVTALTRDDVLAAHKGSMARDRIYVSAVGDISAAELGPLLDALLGELPATGIPQPQRADLTLTGGTVVQEFPGPQSVVQFAQGGIAFDDPDYFPAAVLNEILGGGRFSARLMNEVREKRGLTYGIGTALANYRQASSFVGGFSSANDKVGEAIQVVKDVWAKVAAEGVTPEELATTKTYMTGDYPLRFDGNGPIAGILVGMQILGLPSDYPALRNARVEAVTLADVKRVAARLLQPDQLAFVVVGQPVGVVSTP